MSRLDYYRAVLLGVVLGTSFLTLFYMVNVAVNVKDEEVKSKSNFEIVDNYKGCDVVRYENPQLANYHFFLDCRGLK